MTEEYFFDTDCISAFLWIKNESIMADSEEYKQYCSMAISPASGQKLIGKGEAACIALAKKYDGVLSSNNLRDIMLLKKRMLPTASFSEYINKLAES